MRDVALLAEVCPCGGTDLEVFYAEATPSVAHGAAEDAELSAPSPVPCLPCAATLPSAP